MRYLMAGLALLAGMSNAVHADDRFEPVRAYIQAQMAEGGVPGVSVAVSQHGRVLWTEGFGWADKERRIAATPDTLFSLASISKPITATGLMVLAEAGQVDLDAPINGYLGAAPLAARVGHAQDATVRRVANHSSGLPLHYQFFFSDEAYVRPAREETIRRYGNLITVPGEKVEYSNLGYGVLDHLISRVSGMEFADFMSRRVFAPLGLSRMSVGVPPGAASSQALRYDDDGSPIPFYDSDHPGASAVYASAQDLLRFGMFHLKDRVPGQHRVLSDAGIDAMQRVTSRIDQDSGYGVAWKVEARDDGYRVVEHGGGMPGVGVVLILVPAEDVAVVVLTNHRYGRHRAIADQILHAVLPQWQPAPQADRSGRWTPPAPTAKPAAVEVPTELQGRWAGMLHTPEGDVPVSFEFLPTGLAHAELQGRSTPIERLRVKDGWVEGRFEGEIDNPDVARRAPYSLSLALKLRGPVLNGAVIARSDGMRGSALNHWVSLQRQHGGP